MTTGDIKNPQRFADDPVLNLGCLRDTLDLGVSNNNSRRECPMDRDVDSLVDCRRNQEPAKLTVVRGEIRPTPSQTDPQRTSCDDQSGNPKRTLVNVLMGRTKAYRLSH